MDRVLVIGSPGAGKSTLARELAGRTGLPLVHLDAEHWSAGWIEMEREAWAMRVTAIVAQPRWIIDGNYGGTLPQRVARADTVVWLDYPTTLCLWRVIRRWGEWRGRSRPDMTPGCPERLDPEFLLYVARFRSAWRGRNKAALAQFTGTVRRFTSPAATARWLASLPAVHGNRAVDVAL